MAIKLKGLLIEAENTGQNPDGSPFQQRSGPNALTYPEKGTPLIIKGLPGVEDPTNGDGGLLNQVTDNFVRGGAIGLFNAAKDDLERFSKVILSPNGLAWSAAQLALARTNPQGPIPDADPAAAADPDKGKFVQFVQGAVASLKNSLPPRNQVTLPISTGLTIGTGAAGVRFRKDGLLDLKIETGHNYDPTNGGAKYDNITTSNAKVISEKALESNKNYNRLLNLYGKNQLLLDPSMSSISDDFNFLLEYGGGAHSIFGIGRTRIKKYRSNPYNDIGKNGGYLPIFNQHFFSLRQGSSLTKADSGKANYTDYKKYGRDHKGENYKHKVKSTRIGLYKVGDPGRKPTPTTPGDPGDSYRVYDSKTIDKISAANIFKRTSPEADFSSEFKDYIKFRIAVVDTENPLNDNVILFRALLDNVADNFTGDWNSYKYNGRAEKFYTYSGFDRAITFGFKIHTQTRWEQKPLWRKLNYLVAQTAPEYKQRRMRGVFSRLTIGDWMNEIPGFFTSVNLSWNTAYPWEIRHDGGEGGADADLNEYPHILDVSCNFQPVHNFAPSNSPTTPFLLPEIGVSSNRKYAQQSDDELIINQFTTLAGNKFTDGVAKDAASAYYDNEEAIADARAAEERQMAEDEAAMEAEMEEMFDDDDVSNNLDLATMQAEQQGIFNPAFNIPN